MQAARIAVFLTLVSALKIRMKMIPCRFIFTPELKFMKWRVFPRAQG